jgi:hypothetical protein
MTARSWSHMGSAKRTTNPPKFGGHAWPSGSLTRIISGFSDTYIRNIEGSGSKGGSMENRRADFVHSL